MKRKLLTTFILLATMSLAVLAQFQSAPAFPGAEGHGRFVTGGRGGEIRYVTNLNNSGTGSFREAVKGDAKKIVVFNVGGVIALASDLTIGANTTILGQTAPAPGITLRYYTVSPGANNIIRFIRMRRGQEKDINDGADACWQRQKTGIIFDHCSFSWSIDEVASFYDNNNFTMQWCTVAESLTNAGHDKGAHGYGGIWGGKLVSFHHNMIAHVSNRGPRFNGARYEWSGYTSNKEYGNYNWENYVQAENVDFRNCVMYNAQGTCYGGPGGGQINMVNNYYKAGPCGNGNQERITLVTVASSGNSSGHPNIYDMTSRYYISGNTTQTTAGVKTENKDWAGVDYDSGVLYQGGLVYSKDANNLYPADVPSITYNNVRYVQIKMDEPAPTGYVTTHTADGAFDKVLAYVGASYSRDNVDARYVEEAMNGTATYKGSVTGKPGIIDVVADVEGYTEETFESTSHPAGYDTDGDGIPDEWETTWGLDPDDASDAKKYSMDPNGYYTNLEMYANSLVEDIMKGGCSDGEANYTEYWPELKVIEPSEPGEEGEDVSIYLAQSTNVSGQTTSASYAFEDGEYTVTITNANSKKYAKGSEDGIKYSKGVQYTINLPSGIVVKEVVLAGYDNYDDTDAYLSELNGQKYAETDYVFPMKDSSGNYKLTTQKVTTNATGTLTFTPAGQQVVWTITLNGTKATGANVVKAERKQANAALYNIVGQKVSSNYKGFVVKDGKKFVKTAQ